MTDQTIPDGLTRAEAQAVREWAERARNAQVQDGTVAHAARVLLAVLPKLPTLADMSPEERSACQWFQADVETWGRVVIIAPNASDRRAMTLNRRGYVAYEDHESVTPRPDLPRMTWPGETPAPALPEGWRQADHPGYGRVLVTTPEPDCDGDLWFIDPSADPGSMEHWCDPDVLTFLDTDEEGDTDD